MKKRPRATPTWFSTCPFTDRKKQANAFDLCYAETVQPSGPGWELCERILSRRDVVERMSDG